MDVSFACAFSFIFIIIIFHAVVSNSVMSLFISFRRRHFAILVSRHRSRNRIDLDTFRVEIAGEIILSCIFHAMFLAVYKVAILFVVCGIFCVFSLVLGV